MKNTIIKDASITEYRLDTKRQKKTDDTEK